VRRALAAAVVAILAGDAALLYVQQEPKPVTVDDALAQFRRRSAAASQPDAGGAAAPTTSSSAPAAAAPDPSRAPASAARSKGGAGGPSQTAAVSSAPRPRPGVYLYKTSGYETVDVAGGARHDYPSQTTVTVTVEGCGWNERWQPLEERWDETGMCARPTSSTARDFRSYHEFFKKSQEQHFTCPDGTEVARYDQSVGAQWSWTCSSGPSRFDTTTTFVGMETLVVGGQPVSAARFHHAGVMTGANRGTQVQERWVDPSTGLSLMVKNDIDAEADSPFGTVRYREHYSLDLASLTPRT
jgi:hypothetical protein